MTELRIGILYGGRSEEHPISVKSAREVARHLDRDRYEAYFVEITEAGAWYLVGDHGGREPVLLPPDPAVHGLVRAGGGTVRLDLVFPVLHGRLGEDGGVQGLLEFAGIPYVGCDIQSSALCMDKSLAYIVAAHAGVATPAHWVVTGDEPVDPRVTYPAFVKPARSGSSFGVSRVLRAEDVPGAIRTARRYDTKVLIEAAVDGAEVGCAILGSGADLLTGEVDRIALSHGFFRIHQEDRPEDGSQNATPIVPADIPAEASARVRETAERVYRALGCRGLARVDMFLRGDGTVVLNEVNTMPGLTSYSRYPRMMAAAGRPLGEVIDRLVALTLSTAGHRR